MTNPNPTKILSADPKLPFRVKKGAYYTASTLRVPHLLTLGSQVMNLCNVESALDIEVVMKHKIPSKFEMYVVLEAALRQPKVCSFIRCYTK